MAREVERSSTGRPLTIFERKWNHFREGSEEKKRKAPLRTEVHPIRIIAYLVQLAIVIFAYDFLRNFFMMLALTVVAAAPVLDIVGLFVVHKYVSVKIKAPEKSVNRFSIGYLKITLNNPSFFISFDVNVKLDVENTFYKDMSGAVISLPLAARGSFEKHIPVKYSMNGNYKYSIKTITVRDILGFISLKKNVDSVAEVQVYPDIDAEIEVDMTDISRGMTESEETVKKGHDFSDVSDVREYIPGDKLMSIHWKLSAKRDILMVKDRVSMSDQQMVILVELGGSDEVVDEVLSLSYAVVKGLARQQTFVRLMWWSEGGYAFEERQILNYQDLKDAFTDIYFESTYADDTKTEALMRSIRPELKAYVKICMRAGGPDAVVVEQ